MTTMNASPPTDDDRLDAAFAALANSTRRRILQRLAAGPAGVNELAEPFDLTLPAISKHLKVLERAGLIVRGRHAQYRPCAIDPAPLEAISGWMDQQRASWHQRFDRLDDYLVTLGIEEATSARDLHDDGPGDRHPYNQDPNNQDPNHRGRNPTDD